MPTQVLGLEMMDEDQLMEEVLDKFINSHEQTYEEFLNTFTYLSKEDNVTKRGAVGTHFSENLFTSIKVPPENKPNDYHLRKTASLLHTSSQCSEEEQIVMDEGQKVSSSFQGDLTRAGKVKVDNFLDLEDLDMDEETKPQKSKDVLLLPGEVEEDLSTGLCSFTPSVDRPLTTEVKPKSAVKGTEEKTEEILGDEVQPFSLDDTFDYDNVTLTPKFTPAEIEAIQARLKRERKNMDLP